MSTPLKFEFDFDEVFEGIKLGVIKELSETSFDGATNRAVNEIKAEIKNKISLTYADEYEMKDEIKKEIKEKVYEKLISDIKEEYKNRFKDSVGKDMMNAIDSAEDEIINEIKSNAIRKLYDELYSDIEAKVRKKVNDSISQIVNAITGNSIKVKDSGNEISKEEYKNLVKRDKLLTALEHGGVDNWTWYGESISKYEDEFGEIDDED